jgi:hypothetical protein
VELVASPFEFSLPLGTPCRSLGLGRDLPHLGVEMPGERELEVWPFV